MSGPPVCGLCGRVLPAEPERRVYSSWTGAYYCAPGMQDKCHAIRARARRREQQRPEAPPAPEPEPDEEQREPPMQLALAVA